MKGYKASFIYSSYKMILESLPEGLLAQNEMITDLSILLELRKL